MALAGAEAAGEASAWAAADAGAAWGGSGVRGVWGERGGGRRYLDPAGCLHHRAGFANIKKKRKKLQLKV